METKHSSEPDALDIAVNASERPAAAAPPANRLEARRERIDELEKLGINESDPLDGVLTGGEADLDYICLELADLLKQVLHVRTSDLEGVVEKIEPGFNLLLRASRQRERLLQARAKIIAARCARDIQSRL